jgi:hypothetical protein
VTVDKVIASLNPTATPGVAAAAVTVPKLQELVQPALDSAQATTDPVQALDLRSRVSGLAQAIGAFDGASTGSDSSVTRLDLASAAVAKTATSTLAVGSMVDVMKQFDANGNLVAGQGSTIAATVKPLNVSGIQDAAQKGFLAGTGGK